jgi:hypothetical protein
MSTTHREADLAEVTFIERVAIASKKPSKDAAEAEMVARMNFVNRCLKQGKGRILGIEKGIVAMSRGETQMIVQQLTYHIGFVRKPASLDTWRAEVTAAD